jgi:hypothetical protein
VLEDTDVSSRERQPTSLKSRLALRDLLIFVFHKVDFGVSKRWVGAIKMMIVRIMNRAESTYKDRGTFTPTLF